MDATRRPVVLVGGPTASGKSPLALALARAHDGVVINADSMQVYRDLAILTARPSPADEAMAPHRLFGFVDAARRCSVGIWLEAARAEAEAASEAGRLPILVGGTGLYLADFLRGLSPMPDVPEAIRATLTRRMEEEGSAALHVELATLDPDSAARLAPGDRQRIQRALEVVVATGEPLSSWQRRPRSGGWSGPALQIWLDPARDALYAACDRRFGAMLEAGALDEVRALAARDLAPELPAMRALGVPELIAHLTGALSLEEAATRARTATRQYAKRQTTWFRHQAPGALRIAGFGYGPQAGEAHEAVARFLLTMLGSRA